MQLENGPAVTCSCDVPEQRNSRVDSACKTCSFDQSGADEVSRWSCVRSRSNGLKTHFIQTNSKCWVIMRCLISCIRKSQGTAGLNNYDKDPH